MNRQPAARTAERSTRMNQQQPQPKRPASAFDVLGRLSQVESEIERLEAEAQNLRDRLKAYLEDVPGNTIVDEVTGVEARLVTLSRRQIDAAKVPGFMLEQLAQRDLVTVKVAAAPVVPADAVTVNTTTQLRVKRIREL